jgi:hypothetical protein
MGRLVLVVLIALGATLAGAQRYSVPRTPWGDPDLQGSFTNSNEYATPLERPDRFAGRRLEDLTDAEIVSVRREASQQAIDGLAPGPRGPDYWWLENLRLERRRQAWSVIDPPDGRIPPLTDAGRRRATGPSRQKTSFQGGPFDTPDDLGLLERCISRGVPGSMIPVMYGNTYDIVQTPGAVAITYEIIHETRVIPLDGRPHLHPGLRTYMGDARGRWEGDTLVVETTNFNQASAYRNANAATLKVIERFTRVAPDEISWTATMDDPETWARPWTIRMPLVSDTHGVMPFECHEGNYGLANILKAARAAEAAR